MATERPAPRVVVFAGPNGAGKSTHADAILAELHIFTFVNADFIARGLAGQQPQTVALAAGRIMLNRLRELSQARADFAFESTPSKLELSSVPAAAQSARLPCRYLLLCPKQQWACPAPCQTPRGSRWPRCASRCGQAQIRAKCLHNFFQLYAGVADEWMVFDNSSGHTAQTVAHQASGQQTIKDEALWRKLQTMARN